MATTTVFERGLLAGAAGTLALDTYTYGDIFATARPASDLPATTVRKIAERTHLEPLLGDDGPPPNRRTGAGALLGYGVGLGAGVVYAAVRPALRALPWPLAGALLGLSTLLVSEGSATALGATDWRTWTPSQWAADIVPRTLYGVTVAYVIERFLQSDDDSRALTFAGSAESIAVVSDAATVVEVDEL